MTAKDAVLEIDQKNYEMMELQIFNHQDFGQIRVVEQDGEPWFVAADVCRALELDDTGRATARLDEDELTRIKIVSGGQNREMLAVTEPGLYSLVLGSRKPEAKSFKRWITHEVLPSIRKTGVYVLPTVKQRGLTTDDYLKAAAIVSGCRNERMPYVLGFLEQAGFSIPKIQNQREELSDELMIVLNEAVTKHGFTARQLGALTGIDFGTISQYRRGRHRPSAERSRYIIHVVKKAIAQKSE